MDNLQYAQATHSTMMASNYIFLTAEFETLLSTNHNPFIKSAVVSEVDISLQDCTELSIIDPSIISATVSWTSKPTTFVSMENFFH